MDRTAEKTLRWTVVGVLVASLIGIATILSPELRLALGLDKPPEPAPIHIDPHDQNQKPNGREPVKPNPSLPIPDPTPTPVWDGNIPKSSNLHDLPPFSEAEQQLAFERPSRSVICHCFGTSCGQVRRELEGVARDFPDVVFYFADQGQIGGELVSFLLLDPDLLKEEEDVSSISELRLLMKVKWHPEKLTPQQRMLFVH